MKKSKFLILLLSLFLPFILSGQYSGFDLSRYKLPDIKLNKLDANFNYDYHSASDHSNPSDSDSTASRSSSSLGSINLDFYHFRNTEKYQGDLIIKANAYRNPESQKLNDYFYRKTTMDENVDIKSTNRFYYQKLNFLEFDPAASANKNVLKEYYDYPGNSTLRTCNDIYTVNVSLPFSIGHGRIESVEDLRLAIYILEELNKVGKIDSLPSDNVLLDMAKQISKIKRERFFDTRIRKIRELQVIDSFLISNKIVSSDDISYFAVLNDQWDYASGPIRSSGFAINAGVDDHFNLTYTNLANSFNEAEAVKTITSVNTYDISGFFQAAYYKPVNLCWQTSVIFRTSYGPEFTRDSKDPNNRYKNFNASIFNTALSYSIQYLPDSRTSFSLNFSGSYKNSRGDRTFYDPDPFLFKMNDKQFTFNAGLNIYYYISPQFRIQLDSDINYYTHTNLNTNNTLPDIKSLSNSYRSDFALTLIYSLF